MHSIRISALCAALAAICMNTASSSAPLLSRAIALNPNLHSYQAKIHADISLKTFPYVSPSLDGMYYHKEPDKNKIVFTSGLPTMASEFSKVYPEVPSPAQWNQRYSITQGRDDGRTTFFKLVPRKHGRVDHIDVGIDDAAATVLSMRWNYNDGGYAELHQTYSNVDGNLLVTGQTGHFEVPLYKADVSSAFTDFKLNPPLSDSLFKEE